MKHLQSDVLGFFRQNFFTVGIFFSILLAEMVPWLGAQKGPLKPEITVKYLAVSFIFYSSGLTIKWKELCQAFKLVKLHAFIQVSTFGIIPIFIHFFLFLMGLLFDINTWIHKGLIIVGCMPPPVSSAVILTKSVGGNEAGAIFNSALGSILGIFLTPLLLLFHVGISSTLPILRTVLQLGQTMLLPILFGQISQKLIPQNVLSRIPFSLFGQICLLFIIYTSFCDMFLQEDFNIDAKILLLTVFLIVIMQIIFSLLTFKISSYLCEYNKLYSPQDVITITFCSTHKSLTLGMPLLKTLYSGYAHLSQITLPLLIYHPVQLILGGILVSYGRKWLKKHSKSGLHKRP